MTVEIKKVVDEITVVDSGCVFYRETSRIYDGGNEVAKTFHRTSLPPGSDLSSAPQNVASICRLTWTPEVIQNYKNLLAANGIVQP